MIISKLHEISIQFFDVDGGDAIWIRYLGNDNLWHNILIDGGYIGNYDKIFKPVIDAISQAGECIDLWVITHIDLDHIGAIISFTRDISISDKHKLVKLYWFNHANYKIPDTSGKIGYRQGIDLRSYLESINKLSIEQITEESGTKDFHGLQLTLLSPTVEKIAAADRAWIEKEKKKPVKVVRSQADHHKKIEDFEESDFAENVDVVNGSSITFILKFKGIAGLLLADSHPTDVVNSLRKLNYSQKCPLLLSFVKVSHHGSKSNTSTELLSLIRTGVYVLSANGITNKHPDKETLARILKYHTGIGQPLKFVFTANTDKIKSLFKVDENAEQRYNFTQSFIEKDKLETTLSYLPITLK
jgi:beta-lactamase superfamily II metal-dependent hydrolase